jgi:hypothetical protein
VEKQVGQLVAVLVDEKRGVGDDRLEPMVCNSSENHWYQARDACLNLYSDLESKHTWSGC